jgi:hypothetical protein
VSIGLLWLEERGLAERAAKVVAAINPQDKAASIGGLFHSEGVMPATGQSNCRKTG